MARSARKSGGGGAAGASGGGSVGGSPLGFFLPRPQASAEVKAAALQDVSLQHQTFTVVQPMFIVVAIAITIDIAIVNASLIRARVARLPNLLFVGPPPL